MRRSVDRLIYILLCSSLIVQHAFENLDDSDKADCVREVLDGIDVLALDQWGSKFMSLEGVYKDNSDEYMRNENRLGCSAS
jgi:hypothetical protein